MKKERKRIKRKGPILTVGKEDPTYNNGSPWRRDPKNKYFFWKYSRNFPEIKKEKKIELHIEKVYHVPGHIDSEWCTPRHSLIKLLNF